MLYKLITLVTLAAMAVAAPSELFMRDSRKSHCMALSLRWCVQAVLLTEWLI